MKLWVLGGILCIFFNVADAQDYIDELQLKIDLFDSVPDQYISLPTEILSQNATEAFIHIVDSLQKHIPLIIPNSNLQNDLTLGLYKELALLKPVDFFKTNHYLQKYKFLWQWLQGADKQERLFFLSSNPVLAFDILPIIKNFPSAEQFVMKRAINQPEQVLTHFIDIMDTEYGAAAAIKATIQHPANAKKYFSSKYPLFHLLQQSKNDTIISLLDIHYQLPRNTKAYYLADAIYNDSVSLNAIDSIYQNDSEAYLQLMIHSVSKSRCIAKFSLEQELSYHALKLVRPINDMHEIYNPAIRFASIKKMTAAELYTLMVYSEEEIFTSSFNGFFSILMQKMEEEDLSGYELFANLGFHKFRTFIKMNAGFGKLDAFFNTCSSEEKTEILSAYVSDLPNTNQMLEEAVSIAEAFTSLEDSTLINHIAIELAYAYYGQKNEKNKSVYGLLMTLLHEKVAATDALFEDITTKYTIQPLDKLSVINLLGADSLNTQLHLFYDDKDGKASYASFVQTFNAKNWKIRDYKEFITISSTVGNKVTIYANKPAYEGSALTLIQDTIEARNEVLEMVVHRGHSYYVDQSITNITKDTKLVMLGSCGGYHRLTDVLNKAPDVNIIATKQIGTQRINNPLLFGISESIRKNEDLVWQEIWQQYAEKFANLANSSSSFHEYIGPHQNLGAQFIQAYYQLNLNP